MSRAMGETVTKEDRADVARSASPVRPGIVLALAADKPTCQARPLERRAIRIGRSATCDFQIDDELVSRDHVAVSFDGARFRVTPQGRNGTFVNGFAIEGETVLERPSVLRVGHSLLLLEPDTRRFAARKVMIEGASVLGPAMQTVLDDVTEAAHAGEMLLVEGESGTGKELVAICFHARGPHAVGPFVPQNCAAIPANLAESILFGSVKGAFTDAQDQAGLFGSAHGGVLFLDEIGTLDLAIQAKLLRVLQTKRFYAMGSTKERRADVLVCAATNEDLLAAGDRGAFRPDLYARLSEAVVRLPPLRDRLEEIPYLIELALAAQKASVRPSVRFVEACLLRRWHPTNIRGLNNAIKHALRAAKRDGAGELLAEHLPDDRDAAPPAPREVRESDESPALPRSPRPITDEQRAIVIAAYKQLKNVRAAGAKAGVARQRAYDILRRAGISLRDDDRNED